MTVQFIDDEPWSNYVNSFIGECIYRRFRIFAPENKATHLKILPKEWEIERVMFNLIVLPILI